MSVTKTKLIDGYAFEIESSGFNIKTDAPVKLGGQGSAPDPHDYVEAALAGCTIITLMMYAKRRSLPLLDIDVTVKITAEGAKNEILREVKLIGDELTVDQKASLMSIAEKCPIHKLLSAGASITTRML